MVAEHDVPAELIMPLLVLARVGGLLLLLPGLKQQILPARWRLALGLLICAPVFGLHAHHTRDMPLVQLLPLLLPELAVGVCLAVAPAALVWGLRLATRMLQGMTGLPGGEPASADGISSGPALERLLVIVATTLFFLSNGHRHLVHATLDTFTWLPPGQAANITWTPALMVDVLQQSFALGVRAVLPVAAALFMSILAVAAANRVMPQLGYFAVGMSVQTAVLLGSLVVSLGTIGLLLDHEFSAASHVAIWKAKVSAALQVSPLKLTPGEPAVSPATAEVRNHERRLLSQDVQGERR